LPKTTNQDSDRSLRPRYLTVGQTARILGISPSTLRLWENVGLISPARSSGRYRLYNPELLGVLKRIKYLRDVKKLSVPGIKQQMQQKKPTSEGQSGVNHKPDIGAQLRKMRKSLDRGIVQAAKQAGISPGFLSAIELSKANPSIATLQRLAAAYDTTVLEFFDIPRHSRRLIRPGQRRVLKTESGVTMELLSIGTKMLECHLFRRIAEATGPTRTRVRSSSTCSKAALKSGSMSWNAMFYERETASGLKAISATDGSIHRTKRQFWSGSILL
jgi:DNA-binding transcriptional MerR regulator